MLLASLVLGACGGGSAPRSLAVDFSYPQTEFRLWKPVSVPVQASGLEGLTPHCEVLSGRLPAGLVLLADGCAISGTPTEVTALPGPTVRLTVPGFDVQVDRQIPLRVYGPPVGYELPAGLQEAPAGTPFSAAPTEGGAAWMPATGESLSYEVAGGALPEGLRLDPASGRIDGVLTAREAADFGFTIGLTAASALGTYSATSPPLSVRVLAGLNISYLRACYCRMLMFSSVAPSFAYPPGHAPDEYVFSGFRLAPASGALPPGMSLDARTGVISGTPSRIGTYHVQVVADVAAGGQSGPISAGALVIGVQP